MFVIFMSQRNAKRLFFTIFALTYALQSHAAQTVMPDVEGFEGGTLTLPCTLTPQGTLRWRSGGVVGVNLIATKPLGGPVIIQQNSPFTGVVSITGEFNLRISSLSADRDNNKQFTCEDTAGGGSQVTTVRVLVRITGVSISEANNGTVTLKAGEPKPLTCTVTGKPNPGPSYTWTVDDRMGTGEGSTFSLTADKSTKTVKCTATNRHSNGSVLSTAETTATLNVLYLDSPTTSSPVTVTENEWVTLSCRAEGNPSPHFEWRRSRTTEIRRSPDYTIENVERSAAGEYTCTVSNSVGSGQTTVTLVVHYPPDVTVTYDSSTQTLTCTADGVPNTYTFSPWEHRVGGKLVQTLHTNLTTITLPGTLTYKDTGDYVCSVSNGIKQTQTGHQYIAPQTAAVFQDQKQNPILGLGKTQEISVPFYTHSETSNVMVDWQKSGASNVLQSHREEKGLVSLVFHGQTVSIEGTVTILTLRDVTQPDEGNYTVSVTTDISGVTETKHKSVYVEVKTVPGPSSLTGPIAGGVMGGCGVDFPCYNNNHHSKEEITPIRRERSRSCGYNQELEMSENRLYASSDGQPTSRENGVAKKKKGKTAKAPKPVPHEEDAYEMCEGNSPSGAHNNNAPFKPSLNYQEVKFDKTKGKPVVHPRQSPTNYADIDFSRRN